MLPVLYHNGYCLVRVSCEKPRSVPMPSHLGSVDVRGWVQRSFERLRDWWVKGETSAECKSIMIALLRVTSGLDPF